MLSHKFCDLWVSLDFSGGFCGLSPGEAISLRWGSSSSSFPWISSVFGQVASLLVGDEALLVSNVLSSFTRRVIDFIHVHSIGVGARGSASWWNVAVSPSLEFPKLYHVVVELSSFFKPLFPLPASLVLPVRGSGGGHHNGELLGYSSLEGIYQDAVC